MAPPSSLFAERVARFARGALQVAACAVVWPALSSHYALAAQALQPKRALTVSVAPGCENVPGRAPLERRDNAEARRLAAAGQEAALVGDQRAARDAFAKAAALNPGDDRIAYDLGRAHEELVDTLAAIGEYCRYLSLSPAGREAADVRSRLQRLVPAGAARGAVDLMSAFRLGLLLYDSTRYDAAERAFDDVVQKAPSAAEGYFNRGLMRAVIGRREDALKDFEAYLAANPSADDRADVTRAIGVLRRPVYGSGTALVRGIVPGFGQFYTNRPVRGVVVLGAVVTSAALALYKRTGEKQIPYVDPNGVPAPYTVRFTERPYFAPAVAVGAGLTLAAALEAMLYAKRASRGADVLRTSSVTGAGADRGRRVALVPELDSRGRPGLQLSARF